MKKKLLAVILSAVMVMSSLTVGMAATESTLTSSTFLGASTSQETVSGNFHATYTFHNAGGGANYQNFILQIKDNGSNTITGRADRCCWADGDYADTVGSWGANCAYYDLQGINWDTFATDMTDADVTVDVYRYGDWISWKVLYECADATYEYICELPELVGLADDLYLSLSGENVTLTNITYTENTAPADGALKTAAFGYAKTDKQSVKGNFDITYKYNNATYGTASYHNGFVMVTDNNGNDIVLRADRCAFTNGDYADIIGEWGANVTYTDIAAINWTNFMTTMADADVTVRVVREGDVLSWTYTMTNGAEEYSFTGTTPELTDISDDLYVYVSGELTTISDVEYYNDVVDVVGGAYRTNEDNTVDLAFISQVDIEDFADATEIGVVLANANGVEKVGATPMVSSNTEAGADEDNYAFRSIIYGVDTAAEYTATPYMVLSDGTTVYGTAQTISVDDLMN